MILKNITIFIIVIAFGNLVSAQKYLSKEMPEVSNEWNGNTFTSTKTFAENIQNAPEFTILSNILTDKSIQEVIEKNEMVTIFAVTDNAFANLPKKENDSLLVNKQLMLSMVKYLIVPGRIDQNGLETEAKNHNGQFFLATLNGENLGVMEEGGELYLIDSEKRRAKITDTNFYHKNGFFHIVDGLVFPASAE